MKIPFSFAKRAELSNNNHHGLEVCLLPDEKNKSVMQHYFFLNDTPCTYYITPGKNTRTIEKYFLFNLVIATIPGDCIKITAKRLNNIHPAK